MFYRTTLVVCCIAAAVLMAAIFYHTFVALMHGKISELDAIYAMQGSVLGAGLFAMFALTESDQTPSITNP